jgi:hypothetical protein
MADEADRAREHAKTTHAARRVGEVAITMRQSHLKHASAGPPSEVIYRAQHLNLF